MSRFIDEANRLQGALLPETIDEYVSEENTVRVIDAFVGALDLAALGFEGVEPEATGRPAYHPATMLKIYLYGYLNRIQSTRRLEHEARRSLELMWLVGCLEYAIRRFTSVAKGMAIYKYWSSACPRCALRAKCTTSDYRRIGRWEHEAVLDKMQERLDANPEAMRMRRQTVEHPFGTIKAWMGATHFLCRRLPKVSAEMSLHVLAYNLKRVMKIMGNGPLIEALRA